MVTKLSLDDIANIAAPAVDFDSQVFLDTRESVEYIPDDSTKLTLTAYNRNRSEPRAEIAYESFVDGEKIEAQIRFSEQRLPAWSAKVENGEGSAFSAKWFHDNIYTKIIPHPANASKTDDGAGLRQANDVTAFVTEIFEAYLQNG